MWWKITYGPLGSPISYAYFQGTKAAAEAKAALAVNGALAGPFATEADAEAAKGAAPESTSPAVNAKNAITGNGGLMDNILGLPSLSNTRGLAVRVVKVVLGVGMILIGLIELAKPGQILSKLPPVVPV